jgi:hypothetical protein
MQALVFTDVARAFFEFFIDPAKTAVQRVPFFLKNRAHLLANLEALLMESVVDMGQVDFHLQQDIHQPFHRLSIHGDHPHCLSSDIVLLSPP